MSRNALFLAILLLCSGLTGSASAQEYLKESQSRTLFGTIVLVEICYVDGRQDDVKSAVDKVWRRIGEISARTNAKDPTSDVSRINSAGGAAVRVNEDSYRLITSALDISRKAGGMFDMSLVPLVDLWERAAKDGEYPALSEIAEAKAHVGQDKIEAGKDGTVRLLDPESRIDFGGLAAGFAVDEAARVLKAERFHNFMIDAGGRIYAAGSDCTGKARRIGVRDPDRRQRMLDAFELGDAAVSTSSDDEKPIMIKGKRWSRTINPTTGYPQNGVANATVIAPSAVAASALSAALCVLGPEQGVSLIRELGEGYEALMLFRREEGKYEWHSTPGYEDRRVERKE